MHVRTVGKEIGVNCAHVEALVPRAHAAMTAVESIQRCGPIHYSRSPSWKALISMYVNCCRYQKGLVCINVQ